MSPHAVCFLVGIKSAQEVCDHCGWHCRIEYCACSWTPILNRRDDSAQTAPPNSPDQTGAPTTPFLGKITSSVIGPIMVSLPNGMSVGIANFGSGSSGFDAQMLSSLEDLVGNLSSYSTTSKGSDGATQPNAASGSDNNGLTAICRGCRRST
jgi:hypothetical protein